MHYGQNISIFYCWAIPVGNTLASFTILLARTAINASAVSLSSSYIFGRPMLAKQIRQIYYAIRP